MPQPGPGEVLVRTSAVSLGNSDADSKEGSVAGFEFSGVVEALGRGVTEPEVGTRVWGSAPNAFAEFVSARAGHVVPIPDGLEYVDAATLSTGLFTEYGGFCRAGIKNGDTVLVTAASSGIGILGLQVARALGATTVVGTTRNPDRIDMLTSRGADHVIVAGEGIDLAEHVRETVGGTGADVVIDHVGGPALRGAIEAARVGGSVVSVGRLAGPVADIDLFRLAQREVSLSSVSYGFDPPAVITNLNVGVREYLLDSVAAGQIIATIGAVFSAGSASEAMAHLKDERSVGKVVITWR
ncbi:zinc-binding alcohol dehydrogenase family protein [Curtobacterium pusillum]|uniref:quinone oxidoreductase family protein n=1 Tax=Curtobacterium pusillum TaxID=69373 RepID=UPI003818FFCD